MGFAYSLTLHFLSPTIPDPAPESTKTDRIAMAMFLPFSTFVRLNFCEGPSSLSHISPQSNEAVCPLLSGGHFCHLDENFLPFVITFLGIV